MLKYKTLIKDKVTTPFEKSYDIGPLNRPKGLKNYVITFIVEKRNFYDVMIKKKQDDEEEEEVLVDVKKCCFLKQYPTEFNGCFVWNVQEDIKNIDIKNIKIIITIKLIDSYKKSTHNSIKIYGKFSIKKIIS